MVQSVKLTDFKNKLDNLECLVTRQSNEDAQVVAREIALKLYLNEDNQSIFYDEMESTSKMQMFTWFQASPTEVQDAVEVFRDQLIKKQEEEAITEFINVKIAMK